MSYTYFSRARRCFASALWAAALGLAIASGPCAAQSVDAETEALIEQGVARRQAGDDDGALVLFRQAYERSHSARALAQMALAEQAIGDWVHADEHLRGALQVTTDAWIVRNQQALEGALQQIGHRLGVLDVRCATENAELWIDGHRIGPMPRQQPLRLAAGTVLVELRAEGYVTQRRNVQIVAEQSGRETFVLEPVDPATATRTAGSISAGQQNSGAQNTVVGAQAQTAQTAAVAAHTAPAGPSLVGPVVLLGGSVLSFGLAAAFATLRSGAIGTCVVRGSVLECPTQQDAMRAESGRTYTLLTNVTLVTGGALALGGAIWLTAGFLSARDSSPRGAATRIVPTVALSGGANAVATFAITGSF
jgi:hypothetical protein